ncbi:RHS repeat-associated core domain-containing protein [Stigmatella aurantiaca]|uniref:RHS repeat-associated core domain-containing protein n=1 Tax=Stigmatella aurantiaca TaxID=41 RepID=A0A1H7RHX3_STIAU|nr:RHS repeat-associated core domain-containing protein [Stigmatella aurantiaca]SEL59920.1 RHS repeat-associated core domain-containing protein [Stigmatella aurantiaca]
MKTFLPLRRLLSSAVTFLCFSASAQTLPFSDSKIQPPQLGAPQRGSLVGTYAQTAFGPADVARGGFSLAAPFSVPTERGAPLASPFPAYSADAGLSEWGHGWQATLAITRWRVRGDLDYATDELSSPWGRLVAGNDGYWYPAGLSGPVRVQLAGTVLTAFLPDGSTWTFGGQARAVTAQGTYAWYLQDVVSATGRQTHFDYEANASGRLFVTAVSYGGTGNNFQYRIELSYAPTAHVFSDYRSGQALELDRRVSQVRVKARHAALGTFQERWRYELGYQEAGIGTAFYLSQVQQLFSSGETAPPVHYTYHSPASALSSAQFQPVPKLFAALMAWGEDSIQPSRATMLDADRDGRLDFEHSQRHTLFVQEESGFRAEELPVPAAGTEADCRPQESDSNEPRLLTQMWPELDTYQVVSVRNNAAFTHTDVKVCGREGTLMVSRTLPGSWELGANTRLVDVDRDFQPDLVRVYEGGFEVLPNTSTGPHEVTFGGVHGGALMPVFSPQVSWVHDMNGDSLPDLVSRFDGGYVVWLGKGRFGFEPSGQTLPVRITGGEDLTDLSSYSTTFMDVNRDGLTDVLLSRADIASLFINTGTHFAEFSVPALGFYDGLTSPLANGDFSGSGNISLTVTKFGQAFSAALDRPETGLLASADDGKGTVLHFKYGRTPATPGARFRQPVLSALEVESSGYDKATYTYQYLGPSYHSEGKYLVGFDSVVRQDTAITHAVNFLNGDTFAGLMTSATRTDVRTPLVQEYEYHQYEDAVFQGVGFKRLKEEGTGYRDPAHPALSVEEKSQTLAFAGLCPIQSVHTSRSGSLTTATQLSHLPALAQHLHCLPASLTLTGTHSQAALDFQYQGTIARNAVGLVERVEALGPQGPLVLQSVLYNRDATVRSVSTPAQGTTSFEYEAGSLLLKKVTQPGGVVLEAAERSPTQDGLLSLVTRRGQNTLTQRFRYDGQERLVKQWDSLGAATEANPNLLLEYHYATATRPGSIAATSLVEAASGAKSTTLEYATAAGEKVATATRIPEGWVFDGVTTRSRQQLKSLSHMRPNLPANTDMATLDYATLLNGVEWTASARAAGFGYELEVLTRLHANVQKKTDTSWALEGNLVRQETKVNGTYTRLSYLDAGKRLVRYEDEAQTAYLYGYDVLGRLRSVLLPGGQGHRVAYDGYGRVARVERDGIATVAYQYAPTTGLLSTKLFLTPQDSLVRTESYQYDAIGRRTHTVHADAASGATQTYRFYFDGASPSQPTNTTWPGFLTAITGEGYTKLLQYRMDGSLLKSTFTLHGWRTVETQSTYAEGGAASLESATLKDSNGQFLSATTRAYAWDSYGRIKAIRLNGQPWATLQYNALGQLSLADFGSGTSVGFGYDSLTRRRTFVTQQTPAVMSSVGWTLNARGLTGAEALQVGGVSLSRQYGYSVQGFLTSSADAQGAYGYDFDAAGLPTSITEGAATRSLLQGGNTLTAGNSVYTFDALGRTQSKDGLLLTYGPNGQVAQAQKGATTWKFLYDEDGQRILKQDSAGNSVAAYLPGGSYLDASGLSLPVRVEGQLVGLLQNGTFQPLAADHRGTVLADADGTPRLASPFGNRATHPSSSAALDYVQKAYDADLGFIRMGVRDYDATLNRFTTPDPLFLESPEKCLTSPVECNLYGYVRNQPLDFIDPTGTEGLGDPVKTGTEWKVVNYTGQVETLQNGMQVLRYSITATASQTGSGGPQMDVQLKGSAVYYGTQAEIAGIQGKVSAQMGGVSAGAKISATGVKGSIGLNIVSVNAEAAGVGVEVGWKFEFGFGAGIDGLEVKMPFVSVKFDPVAFVSSVYSGVKYTLKNPPVSALTVSAVGGGFGRMLQSPANIAAYIRNEVIQREQYMKQVETARLLEQMATPPPKNSLVCQ